MDEVLKRRIAGALVLLALSFVLVSLLPAPGLPTPEDGLHIVTVDLDGQSVPPVEIVTRTPAELPTTVPDGVPESAAPVAPATPSDPVAEPLPDTDASVADPAQQPPAPGSAAQPPRPAPKPVPMPTEPAPQKAPTAEAPKKKPAEPAPAVVPVKPAVAPAAAATTRPAPAAATPPPGSGSWFVQVGGFADVANAHQVQAQLKAQGFSGILSPAETARGTLYRVRAGPFANREQAQAAQQRLATAYPGCAIIGP